MRVSWSILCLSLRNSSNELPPPPKKTHTPLPMGWVQVVGMDLQIYPQISRRRLGVTLFKTMRSLRSYIHQKLKILVWKNILTQKAFFYSTYPKKSIEIHPKLFFFDIWIFLELCAPALHWYGIEKRESFGLFCMRDQSERLCIAQCASVITQIHTDPQ